MNAPERILPDVQAEMDHRSLAIDRVGVKSPLHPITVAAADGAPVSTVAHWTCM